LKAFATIGWLTAAVFGVLYFAGKRAEGPVYRDPEAEILRDRVRELQSRLAEGTGGEEAPDTPAPDADSRADPAATAREFTVTVVSAHDLRDHDPLGTGDPFVVVHYDGEERTTKTIRGSRHPTWNTKFTFRHVPDHVLTLTVWDRDALRHDRVGTVSLTPTAGQVVDKPLSLNTAGTLRILLTW
jgi:hypothetical protein